MSHEYHLFFAWIIFKIYSLSIFKVYNGVFLTIIKKIDLNLYIYWYREMDGLRQMKCGTDVMSYYISKYVESIDFLGLIYRNNCN